MRTTASVLLLLLAASPALADDPPTSPVSQGAPTSPTSPASQTPSTDLSIGVGARVSNFGAGGALELRLRTASEIQIGVDASAGRDWDVFVGGYAGHDARRFDAGASLLAPVWRRDDVTMSIGARAYLRRLASATSTSNLAPASSWAAGLDLALLLHAPLRERGMLRVGAVIPVGFEVSPEFHADTTGSGGALLSLGGAVALSDHLALTIDVDAGGAFGANGDGMKFLARGTVALRFQPGARRWLRF
jgi:hypothetical protein